MKFLHFFFVSYMVENGICYMTLCDSSYPRKLALNYLQDLQKEFSNFDVSLIKKLIKPYSFLKFGNISLNPLHIYYLLFTLLLFPNVRVEQGITHFSYTFYKCHIFFFLHLFKDKNLCSSNPWVKRNEYETL